MEAAGTAVGFMAVGFMAVGFMAVGFMAVGFMAVGFMAVGFMAADFTAMSPPPTVGSTGVELPVSTMVSLMAAGVTGTMAGTTDATAGGWPVPDSRGRIMRIRVAITHI
jgi:hypothetical protein